MTVLSEKSGGARAAFTAGALRCAPVALGVLAYGLVFGALAQQAGLSFAETAFMSAIVYSGSAQFVALGLWTLPPPVLALAVATLLVNFRFFLIAAPLGRVLPRHRRRALRDLADGDPHRPRAGRRGGRPQALGLRLRFHGGVHDARGRPRPQTPGAAGLARERRGRLPGRSPARGRPARRKRPSAGGRPRGRAGRRTPVRRQRCALRSCSPSSPWRPSATASASPDTSSAAACTSTRGCAPRS